MEFKSWDTTEFSSYRVSVFGLNISTFSLAIWARRSLLISSSVLPENIDPQMTSMLPLSSFLLLKLCSLNNICFFDHLFDGHKYPIFNGFKRTEKLIPDQYLVNTFDKCAYIWSWLLLLYYFRADAISLAQIFELE